MKVICDVHIAKKICRFFQEHDVEAVHVNDILDGCYTSDEKIREYADKNGFTVVTKDKDFKNSHLLKKSPKKLLSISLGNNSTRELLSLLEEHLTFLKEKFALEVCYVEISREHVVIINTN